MKLLILDLDGTLVDSRQAWMAALNQISEERQLGLEAITSIDDLISFGVDPLLARFFPEVDEQLLAYFWTLVFTKFKSLHRLTFSPHSIKRAFPTLTCGVLTNKRSEHALNFTELFPSLLQGDFFLSADSHRKPSPHWIRHLARTHNVIPEDVLVVGDTPVDMQAALSAGATFAHYTRGYYSHSLPAQFIIDSFTEAGIIHQLGGIIGHL